MRIVKEEMANARVRGSRGWRIGADVAPALAEGDGVGKTFSSEA